jgi:hypothetical protein
MLLVCGAWLASVVVLLSVFSRVVSKKAGSEKLKGLVTRAFRAFRRRTKKATIHGGVDDFYDAAHSIMGRWRVASLVASFSVILWIFGMTRLFIIFQALNYPQPVPIPMLMLAVTLPAIVGLLPLLPGALGTVDLTMVSVFLLFGVPLEIAASVTLIERSITLIFGTVLGASVASYLGVRAWRGIK